MAYGNSLPRGRSPGVNCQEPRPRSGSSSGELRESVHVTQHPAELSLAENGAKVAVEQVNATSTLGSTTERDVLHVPELHGVLEVATEAQHGGVLGGTPAVNSLGESGIKAQNLRNVLVQGAGGVQAVAARVNGADQRGTPLATQQQLSELEVALVVQGDSVVGVGDLAGQVTGGLIGQVDLDRGRGGSKGLLALKGGAGERPCR